jgi:hypothetical protein
MSPRNNSQESSDRVSAHIGKTIFDEMEDYSKHDNFRRRVKEIFADCVKDIDYVKQTKEYAKEAIDEKLFKNFVFWFGILVTAFVTAITTAIASKYIH